MQRVCLKTAWPQVPRLPATVSSGISCPSEPASAPCAVARIPLRLCSLSFAVPAAGCALPQREKRRRVFKLVDTPRINCLKTRAARKGSQGGGEGKGEGEGAGEG